MRVLVAMMAVLAMVSVASANPQVWFTAVGQNANSTVITDGAPGVSTVLGANDPVIASRWLITAHLRAEAHLGGIVSFDIGLATPELDTTADTPTWSGPTGWTVAQHFAGHGTVGMSANVIFNDTEWTASGVGLVSPPDYIVASFYLNDIHEGDADDDFIYGGSAWSGWGFNEFDENEPTPFPQFGGAPAIEGSGGVWGSGPNGWAIKIHEIPEPGTLMLLGLGLVGLLRRR